MSRFAGADPYDALLSGVGSRAKTRRLRQLLVQARKRIPVPSRLWGIPPYTMAKTVGCAVTASARSGDADSLREALEALPTAAGVLGGGSYGYEFDVQTRWAFYPAGSPNLIATVFVARGLGTAATALARDDLLGGFHESADFLKDHLFVGDVNPFFRYTPTSNRLVHNANLLGAGFVATSAALSGMRANVDDCLQAALTSVAAQREDGSWPYGAGSSLGWADNFHTAYNLDGLLQVWLATGDARVKQALDRGVTHWMRDFFGPNGEPKYYPANGLPYDIHSAGTAVDVAARLATWGYDTGELAGRVASWTLANLVEPRTGATYYQKHRWWTDKRHFVRWGDAHWSLGLASLALLKESRLDPLECAVASRSGMTCDAV